MVKDKDMRNQIIESLGDAWTEFDVDGIVSEIQKHYGTVNIKAVPFEVFWDVVREHDTTEQPMR